MYTHPRTHTHTHTRTHTHTHTHMHTHTHTHIHAHMHTQKKTAVMYAAMLNSIAIINLLVQQYKADLFLRDSVSDKKLSISGRVTDFNVVYYPLSSSIH